MKSLVLAEKPSVAKDIARVLKCSQGQGFFTGSRYVVTWALGHLVTLADPESYADHYKTWRLEDLPIIPQKMDLVVIKQTSKQYAVVKNLLKRDDIQEIIIATDAGREGELVARWILEKAGCRKPVKRLWVSSVTDKALQDGFNHLKNGSEYINLYESAQARAIADWVVGINATRALTTKFNAQLSCGRVQTPTLAMVKAAEDSIKSFQPQKFYGISVYAEGINFTWHDKKTDGTRIFDKEQCDKLIESIKGKPFVIKEITKHMKKAYPPKLYDLTELQRDANKLYNFSAKETLNIMQQLYETHKILTYPRTDSRYITTDIVPTIPERLRAITGEYKVVATKLSRTPIRANESFVDNKKVTDHHAIIPTEQEARWEKLNDKERKIYYLVIKRFLSVLLPPCEYEEATIKAEVAGEIFTAKGRRITVKGFREVAGDKIADNEQEEGVQKLPEIQKGNYKITSVKQTQDVTKPPKPLNEATLLSAMENGGLGTVATRADIIEKLFDSFSMEKRGNDIWLTSKGKQILELAPVDLRRPELTAKWEEQLLKISKGQIKKDKFLTEINQYTREIIREINNSTAQYKHDNITAQKCPQCNKNLLEVAGKKGKMLVCQDRECGFRKTVSVLSNARCPQCHKKMELVGEGEKKRFVCVCGFNERLSAFQERREREGTKMSKNEVADYLKKQGKSAEPLNNAMANALKGLKFD